MLDRRRAEIEAAFADPRLYEEPARVGALKAEMDDVRERGEAALAAWAALVERLEGLEGTPKPA
jgi:hypothetical protein